MSFLSSISTSDIVAGTAAFISMCSFIAAIWQGWILQYLIKNQGVGPAIVEGYEFKIKGVVIARVAGVDYIKDVVKQVFENRHHCFLRRHGLPGIGAAIPVGGECILAEIEFIDMRTDVMDTILLSTDVDFSLRYKSLYDEKYLLNS